MYIFLYAKNLGISHTDISYCNQILSTHFTQEEIIPHYKVLTNTPSGCFHMKYDNFPNQISSNGKINNMPKHYISSVHGTPLTQSRHNPATRIRLHQCSHSINWIMALSWILVTLVITHLSSAEYLTEEKIDSASYLTYLTTNVARFIAFTTHRVTCPRDPGLLHGEHLQICLDSNLQQADL